MESTRLFILLYNRLLSQFKTTTFDINSLLFSFFLKNEVYGLSETIEISKARISRIGLFLSTLL